MTTQDFIKIAVDNEFETDYSRQLVKAYLYKALLRNEKTNQPITNLEIGKLLGIHRLMAGSNIKNVESFLANPVVRNNSMFGETFAPKFEAVKIACEAHAQRQMVRLGQTANKRAEIHLENARVAIINRFNPN
jgi:hypothetical protein